MFSGFGFMATDFSRGRPGMLAHSVSWGKRNRIRSMRLTYKDPFLRHFPAHLEPVWLLGPFPR